MRQQGSSKDCGEKGSWPRGRGRKLEHARTCWRRCCCGCGVGKKEKKEMTSEVKHLEA